MRPVLVVLGLVVALALQTTFVATVAGSGAPIDLVLVVTIAVAISGGPVVGMLSGSVGGLFQDALSGGVLGVGGVTKTLVGYFVGQLASHFMVARLWDQLLVFFFGSVIHSGLFIGIYGLLADTGNLSSYPGVVVQAVVNAAIGVGLVGGLRMAPGAIERRRLRRRWRHGGFGE
jgi:rod shape-determining protein MreD